MGKGKRIDKETLINVGRIAAKAKCCFIELEHRDFDGVGFYCTIKCALKILDGIIRHVNAYVGRDWSRDITCDNRCIRTITIELFYLLIVLSEQCRKVGVYPNLALSLDIENTVKWWVFNTPKG